MSRLKLHSLDELELMHKRQKKIYVQDEIDRLEALWDTLTKDIQRLEAKGVVADDY